MFEKKTECGGLLWTGIQRTHHCGIISKVSCHQKPAVKVPPKPTGEKGHALCSCKDQFHMM